MAKLARFKKELAAEKETFYERKERELQDMVEKLEGLGVDKNEAVEKLGDIFKLVIKDRMTEALAPTRIDKLAWYAKERVLREHVNTSIAEKEAMHLRSRRK